MIATILLVGLALGWLGWETNWLAIRLMIGDAIPLGLMLDVETEFDGSDIIFSDDWETLRLEAIDWYNEELAYGNWLAVRYAPKYTYGAVTASTIDPRGRWMAVEDDLRARRQGEMIYQR